MKKHIGEIFAENLKQKILESGLTQKQLADIVGLPQQSFTPWLKRGIIPTQSNIRKLCEALNCEEYELFVPKSKLSRIRDNIDMALKIMNAVNANITNTDLLKLMNLCTTLSASELKTVINFILNSYQK